ncbi:hypothetical protein [Halogeometricum sp. CBA1124]|uniref:PKD domain-containing protein n=1 Tax=Halogeometricum sp. CBA1124 TaxID=2668071 RepID=UPI001E510951|nr:hypothetical protein [Halogeometricum sp. CBA1124]
MAYADTAEPEILAPEVTKRTNYTFAVTVTDEAGATATDTVTITVRPPMLEGDTLSDEQRNGVDDSDAEQSPDSGDDSSEANGGGSGGDAGDSESDDSNTDDADSETSRDAIAQAVFESSFDSLGAEDAAAVEEFYLRQPDGEWDPSTVKTRDQLAQERYGTDFDELGFDGRVDVQEAFDAQFGDTGGELSKDEISQAKWDRDFANLSDESAGQITELYNRQPWINEDNEHMPTREQWAYRMYDGADLSDLTREQRLEVERRYNSVFVD